MKEIIENIYCDICHEKATEHKNIQIIFNTNQTDGYPCKPYIDDSHNWPLDLCDKCLKKILDGKYVFATGAQGYNTYYFKEKNEQ